MVKKKKKKSRVQKNMYLRILKNEVQKLAILMVEI